MMITTGLMVLFNVCFYMLCIYLLGGYLVKLYGLYKTFRSEWHFSEGKEKAKIGILFIMTVFILVGIPIIITIESIRTGGL